MRDSKESDPGAHFERGAGALSLLSSRKMLHDAYASELNVKDLQ